MSLPFVVLICLIVVALIVMTGVLIYCARIIMDLDSQSERHALELKELSDSYKGLSASWKQTLAEVEAIKASLIENDLAKLTSSRGSQ